LLWALAVIGQLAAALLSPPSTIHLPPAPVLVANLVFLAVLVGPAEELLFRGLIQSGINASVHAAFWLGRWPLHAGTAVAAIVFGLWHLVNLSYQPLGATTAQVLTAAFVGWVIGIFYDRTKNLIGASILHNLIDFFGATTPVLAYFLIHRS
jgi:membrane protease YdiL (CAAX protease family)